MIRLTLLIGLLCLSACQDATHLDRNTGTTQILPPTLTIAAVTREPVPEYYHASGYTYQAENFVVSTSQTATITRLTIDAGDEVQAGDLLLTLDDSELSTALDQARAAEHTARIRLKDSQYEFDNDTRLSAANVIPVEELRKARVQLDIAQSQLEQAQSEVQRLESRRPYFRITSPIHARVSKRYAQQGDLALPGKPLLQLEAMEGIAFEITVPTQWLGRLNVGDSHAVHLHARPDLPVQGKISHIVQSTQRSTQTNPVRLILDAAPTLSVGMSGQVSLELGQTPQLLIPETALVRRAGVSGVFRLDAEARVRFVPVAIERPWQDKRVILAGLNEADQVVLNVPDSLRDGQIITPSVTRSQSAVTAP